MSPSWFGISRGPFATTFRSKYFVGTSGRFGIPDGTEFRGISDSRLTGTARTCRGPCRPVISLYLCDLRKHYSNRGLIAHHLPYHRRLRFFLLLRVQLWLSSMEVFFSVEVMQYNTLEYSAAVKFNRKQPHRLNLKVKGSSSESQTLTPVLTMQIKHFFLISASLKQMFRIYIKFKSL